MNYKGEDLSFFSAKSHSIIRVCFVKKMDPPVSKLCLFSHTNERALT